jgi:hypothetical protein
VSVAGYRRPMFVRPARHWARLVVALVAIGAVAAAAVVSVARLRHPSGTLIHGTFTMFEPLACDQASPSSILHTELVFSDQDEAEVGTTIVSTGVRFATESVRGFVHCRESGTYSLRVRRATSYVVTIPAYGETLPAVSYAGLAAVQFRYDLHY